MNKMNTCMTSTVAGITVAMIAGTAAYMMSDRSHSMQRQAKKLRRAASHAAKNAGVVIDSISDMMR